MVCTYCKRNLLVLEKMLKLVKRQKKFFEKSFRKLSPKFWPVDKKSLDIKSYHFESLFSRKINPEILNSGLYFQWHFVLEIQKIGTYQVFFQKLFFLWLSYIDSENSNQSKATKIFSWPIETSVKLELAVFHGSSSGVVD